MSSIRNDPEQVGLIKKWRLRHAYPDAVGMWANSTGEEAKALAFNAIARDPRVLQRAARPHAVKLAAQAEDYTLSLAGPEAARSDTWLAVALFVQRSIAAWRHSLKAYDRRLDGIGMSVAPTTVRAQLSDPWEIARRFRTLTMTPAGTRRDYCANSAVVFSSARASHGTR